MIRRILSCMVVACSLQEVAGVTQWCFADAGSCEKSVHLKDFTNVEMVCQVHGRSFPLSLFQVFDAVNFRVRRDRLSRDVEIHAASEDTWLTGFTGVTTRETAEEQARAAFRSTDSGVPRQLEKLRRALQALWHGDSANSYAISLSPFGASCIGLKSYSSAFAINVTVEVSRSGPLHSLMDLVSPAANEPQRQGHLSVWSGLVLCIAGCVLFAQAGTLAHSVVFHYASGISVSMALGILLVAVIIYRLGHRRLGGSLFTLLGLTMSTVTMYARDVSLEIIFAHWPYVIAYLLFFALLGYAFTFWRLRGGLPEDHEVRLLAFLMRVCALGLIYASTHSLRASIALIAGTAALYGVPGSAPLLFSYWVLRGRYLFRPASAPTEYISDDGAKRRWVPPTPTGKYLSQDEYEADAQKATDAGLQALFSSPEYRKWLMDNHQRIALADAGGTGGRRLALDEDDDDDDDD